MLCMCVCACEFDSLRQVLDVLSSGHHVMPLSPNENMVAAQGDSKSTSFNGGRVHRMSCDESVHRRVI